MPIIPYKIERYAFNAWRGKKYWYYVTEMLDVDVSDEVAAFLSSSDKCDKRYHDKNRKQKKKAHISKIIFLDKEIRERANDPVKYMLEEFIADTIHFENLNPLNILVIREENAELDDEYISTMTGKQYEVLRLFYQGYNNVEAAKILSIDESSVRERLFTAFKTVVSAYLIHTNQTLFHSLYAEVKEIYGGKISRHKMNVYLGVLFTNRLSFFRHDQIEYVNFVLETDYEAAMKKYFLDFIAETPEKGT